jgi:hypothetical protein
MARVHNNVVSVVNATAAAAAANSIIVSGEANSFDNKATVNLASPSAHQPNYLPQSKHDPREEGM